MEAKELIAAGLESVKRTVDRVMDGLTPEEISWHPRPDANSIGLIMFHMARSEDSFVNRMCRGETQLWEKDKWYTKLNKAIDDGGAHYTAEQVAGFVVPDIKLLISYADAVRKQTLDYVNKIKPAELDKEVIMPQMGPVKRPPSNVGKILQMNVTHLAGHAGDISYIRGLKRGMDK
ncbi:MAG TPA: DinB family protein [Dehalococcoidales bacterium]|nr:DinB family protein [Dehalococcoidales bacterium]